MEIIKSIGRGLKRVGKAVWKALPWVGLAIWLCLLLAMPILHAQERGELKSDISALEAENRMYQSENDLLREEVDWLRGQVTSTETDE